jgi:hypothetical protein
MYKVPLTTAVCCDHLVQMFTGLLSLPTSSSCSVLISGSSDVFMMPAFAPIGPMPALKKGELCRLGRARVSRRVSRKSRGMLGNANEVAAKCVAKLDSLLGSKAPFISSSSWTSISLRNLTCIRGLDSTLFNLASSIASSPLKPTSTNAELRVRREASSGEEEDSVIGCVTGTAELDDSECVTEAIEGWSKS